MTKEGVALVHGTDYETVQQASQREQLGNDTAKQLSNQLELTGEGINLSSGIILGTISLGSKGTTTKTIDGKEVEVSTAGSGSISKDSQARYHDEQEQFSTDFITGVEIKDIRTGKTYSGTTDISQTLERIKKGESYPHRNDGTTYKNRSQSLPIKEEGYYKEYVVPTPNINGPGPQRIIVGKDGEKYYTPDHYVTFIRIE